MANSFAPIVSRVGYSPSLTVTTKSARTQHYHVNIIYLAQSLEQHPQRLVVFKSIGLRQGKRACLLKKHAVPFDKAQRGEKLLALVVQSPRGLLTSVIYNRQATGLYLPCAKVVVGVENAQMGWFNANLGARRTHERQEEGQKRVFSVFVSHSTDTILTFSLSLSLWITLSLSVTLDSQPPRNNVTTSEIR